MRIYHYTSLESLALILQNKTIRFNRLDKVDDLEEGNVESLGIKFCKYIFVSCWTEDENENILYGRCMGEIGEVSEFQWKKKCLENILYHVNLYILNLK